MVEYKKRLVEVDEILSYLPDDCAVKIPKDVIKVIKEEKDKEYKWSYDENKNLEEQNISRDTMALLSYINLKYLLSEEQKEVMIKIHYLNEQKKYNNKEISKKVDLEFGNSSNKTDACENKSNDTNEGQLVKYKEGFFSKIISRIKKFLKIS